MDFVAAQTEKHFADASHLMQQYASALEIDLCFQGFAEELKTLHIQYNLPNGALLLVYDDNKPAGCVAVRQIDKFTAELKRMYILPEYRGKRLGEQLLSKILVTAKELGYEKIRLDTLPSMQTAQKLYKAFGFYEIESYRFNPVSGVVYMEKGL